MIKRNITAATAGALLVALSALGYATNPIFGKLAYAAGANAITTLAIRYLLGAIGLWLIRRAYSGSPTIDRVTRVRLVALGGLGIGVVSLLFFTALEHIGASLAIGLFYTYPAMTAVAGLVRGEQLSRTGYAGLLLTAAGTWLLLSNDLGGFTWQGALLILAAAGLYTAYILVSERWTRGINPITVSAHVTTGGALLFLTMAWMTRQPMPSAGAWAAGAGLALCATILAMVTFFAGLVRVGATRAAIISTLEPVFTTILAVMLLGEHITPLQTVGVGLVVAGAVAAQHRSEPSMNMAPQ